MPPINTTKEKGSGLFLLGQRSYFPSLLPLSLHRPNGSGSSLDTRVATAAASSTMWVPAWPDASSANPAATPAEKPRLGSAVLNRGESAARGTAGVPVPMGAESTACQLPVGAGGGGDSRGGLSGGRLSGGSRRGRGLSDSRLRSDRVSSGLSGLRCDGSGGSGDGGCRRHSGWGGRDRCRGARSDGGGDGGSLQQAASGDGSGGQGLCVAACFFGGGV